MGHHYWTMSRDMTPAEFTAVGEAARRICEACSLDLASGQSGPNSPPIITGDVIRFNGSEQPGGLDFVLKRCIDPVDLTPFNREHFVTCRTYRLPYDPVVCAVLLGVKEQMGPDVRLQSNALLEEWVYGSAEGRTSAAMLYWDAEGQSPAALLEWNGPVHLAERGTHPAQLREYEPGLRARMDELFSAVVKARESQRPKGTPDGPAIVEDTAGQQGVDVSQGSLF